MKRRKIEKNSFLGNKSESKKPTFREELLSQLKGYERFAKKQKKESSYGKNDKEWTIKPHELRYLLGKESKSRILELSEKYFGKKSRDTRRWFGGKSESHTKASFISSFITKFFSEELEKKRDVERTNISELKHHDNAVFELCDINVPKDVILEILSFLCFDSKLLRSVGCVNSSFYIVILGNWSSRVHIGSVEQLYRISLLVLKSMKHVILSNLSLLTEQDIEHFLNNITPERILSLSFAAEGNCKKSIERFLNLAIKNKKVLSGCKSLFLHSDLERKFNGLSHQFYRHYEYSGFGQRFSSPEMKIHYPPKLFANVFPNVDTLYNPFTYRRSCCQEVFKNLPQVKHIITNDTTVNVENLRKIHQQPEILETLELKFDYVGTMLMMFNNISHIDRTTNLLKLLVNIRSLKFSFELSRNEFDTDIDWSFLKETNPKLERLSLRFLCHHRHHYHGYSATSGQQLPTRTEYYKIFNVHFPNALKHLELVDPPSSILEKITNGEAKGLEEIKVIYYNHAFCPQTNEKERVENFFDHVLKNEKINIFEIFTTDIQYGNASSTMTRLAVDKKKKLLRFYSFCTKNKVPRWKRYEITELKKFLFGVVEKYCNVVGRRVPRTEDQKIPISKVFVFHHRKKGQKVWNEILGEIFPPESEEFYYKDDMVEKEEERVLGGMKCLLDGSWMKFERRCFVGIDKN